jgi:hypothetical protein
MGSGEMRGTGGTPGRRRRRTTASGELGRQEIKQIPGIKAMDSGKTQEEDMGELEVYSKPHLLFAFDHVNQQAA